jgi:dihydroxyacetone kinase-like predicted kinase
MQRIGVFVCHCGTNIASTVDVKAVAEALQYEPGVIISKEYQYMCSEAGQELIKNAIKEKIGLDLAVTEDWYNPNTPPDPNAKEILIDKTNRKESQDALAKTPDMLPVLKEVGVVDAGGYGFCTALSGMLDALCGNPVELERSENETAAAPAEANFESFSTEDIKFAYCTECIVDKDEAHVGEGTASELNEFICSMGDSVVFVDDEIMIKLHVHTNHPGLVIEKALEFGAIATMKVENMKLQHSEKVFEDDGAAKKAAEPKEETVTVKKPTKKYGFVSVCMGSGIKATFSDLGVDRII